MLSPKTEDELNTQRQKLSARVAESGLYTHEPAEFDLAVRAYRSLTGRLCVQSDIRSLTTPESRNIVRLITRTDGSAAVLKVMGNSREPGEGEVLQAWHKRGLPCVRPIEWGYARSTGHGFGSNSSYILTAYLEGQPLTHDSADSLEEKKRQLEELVDFIGPFHEAAFTLPTSRSWSERMWLHLKWTVPLVEAAGFLEPVAWREKLNILSSRGRTAIHGDPAGANVIRTAEGLRLLDPPGALIGSREADVAQICAQVGGATLAATMISHACDLDPKLHPETLACLAGINIFVWAGYLLADHSNPDVVGDRSAQRDRRIEEGEKYLAIATELIDSFQLS